jgi:hypothetical protein
MEKTIITGPLSERQKEALESHFLERVNDSLQYGGLSVVWHESVGFRGYFDLADTWDDDGNLYSVLDTGDCEYRITEENEADFEAAFGNARDEACREWRKKHELNPMTWMAPAIGGCGF